MLRTSKQITVLATAYMIFRLCRAFTVLVIVILAALLYSCIATAAPTSQHHPENHCPTVASVAQALALSTPHDLEVAAHTFNEMAQHLSRIDPIMTRALYAPLMLELLKAHDKVVADPEGVAASIHEQALAACYHTMKGVT